MAFKDRGARAKEGKTGTYRASSVELFNREISADSNSSDKIYSRDADNLYPARIERVINNSPTGRRAANLMAKYIAGKGNAVNFPIGKGKYINDIITAASGDIAYQNGVYFRIKYGIDPDRTLAEGDLRFMRTAIEVMDYVSMAKSKEDDDDYPGKFYLIEDDDKGGLLASGDDIKKWFYPFNPDPKIIAAQMRNDCKLKEIEDPDAVNMVRNYRGQVFYLNMTPRYIYALPFADSVYNDLDTEYRISVYNNSQTRKGFLGKTVVTKYEDAEGSEANEDFNDELKEWLGAEESSSVFVVEVPQTVDVDLDKAFIVNQLKPQFDDKLFETTTKNIRKNILGAFNNAPEALVFSGEGAMFGTSATAYTEMKKFYWEQNETERSALEQTLRMFGFDVNFVPIVVETQTNPAP